MTELENISAEAQDPILEHVFMLLVQLGFDQLPLLLMSMQHLGQLADILEKNTTQCLLK